MYFCDYPILQSEKELPLYLLNMGQQHCQDHIIRPEGYPDPQILYCTKGSGTLVIDGKKIPVPVHTAVFLPAAYPPKRKYGISTGSCQPGRLPVRYWNTSG